jgi:FtsP/CotA-like multicopper oxidase with cupredoxin domain
MKHASPHEDTAHCSHTDEQNQIMTKILNRRQLMVSTAAVAGLSGTGLVAPLGSRGAFAAGASLSLTAGRRTIDVNGKAASVFGLVQSNGTPGLILDPGQRFLLNLRNRSSAETIIHWHGQTPPNVQDGVVETGSTLIPPDGAQDYDFAPRAGTHWMHSHHGLQEQQLMAAPLVVRSAADLQLDAQEVTVLLHDFSFRDPTELLGAVMGNGTSHGGMNMPGMGTGGSMAGMAMPSGMNDLNDIDYDAYLANDRTLNDPLVVRTERGGRVRLRLINGATSTAFWIDLGSVEATVIAVDGNPVKPITGRRFPMAQGQRLDLIVSMPPGGGVVPILAQREGDRARTGIILATPDSKVTRIADMAQKPADPADLSLERRLVASAPLAARKADITYRTTLSGAMQPYTWLIDGRSWANHKALAVKGGQRVEVEMMNHSMMAHPMHLHGHHFQVIALNGKPVNGAVRDTVLVPPHMGSVTIAFDADNPGRWLFHCHNLLHMAAGMMTEFAYDSVWFNVKIRKSTCPSSVKLLLPQSSCSAALPWPPRRRRRIHTIPIRWDRRLSQ